MEINSFTNIGKRKSNDDVILVEKLNNEATLCLIADGMGGYSNGGKAASIIVENIKTYLEYSKEFNAEGIKNAIKKANLAIKQESNFSEERMGATIGGVLVNKNCYIAFWVGDVKIFAFKGNDLVFESKAHTLVNALKEKSENISAISIEKIKHVVTKSIQGDLLNNEVEVSTIDQLLSGDTTVICSDGVHDIIDGNTISFILSKNNNITLSLNEIRNRCEKEAIDNYSLISICI